MEQQSPAADATTTGAAKTAVKVTSKQPAECCPPLFGPALSDDDASDLAATLKALADPIRLKLVNIIAQSGEGCACDFPELLDRSQPTVSHHLSILVKAGILEREQRGKWAWFWINNDRLTSVCAALGRCC